MFNSRVTLHLFRLETSGAVAPDPLPSSPSLRVDHLPQRAPPPPRQDVVCANIKHRGCRNCNRVWSGAPARRNDVGGAPSAANEAARLNNLFYTRRDAAASPSVTFRSHAAPVMLCGVCAAATAPPPDVGAGGTTARMQMGEAKKSENICRVSLEHRAAQDANLIHVQSVQELS